jgi:mono/diheme cytochrome c family protein
MLSRIISVGVLTFILSAGALRAQPAADLIEKGKYLATAGDCVSCHSAPGGKPLAGGLPMSTPFGQMVTPNITPDKETGIGSYTDDQFYKTIHEGIGPDEKFLYPVFPYQWYTKITRDDAMAIKAYLFSLPPVHQQQNVNQLNFPFNIRASMIGWRQLFFTAGTFKPDPAKSAEINRGAYLVTGLGHCGECHTTHNALGGSNDKQALQGAVIDNWYAPNLTSDMQEGIGSWSEQQVQSYLKTGVAPGKAIVAGPMSQVVHESLAKLTDSDIKAIAAYLKSVPAEKTFADTRPDAAATATPPGANAYISNCASCHQLNGEGIPGVIPPLKDNGAVLAKGPEDVLRVVLGGLEATKNYALMPAVGAGMTDQEVADATNYVRTAWTNRAPETASAGGVADLRKKTDTMLSGGKCADGDPAFSKPQSGMTPLFADLNQGNMQAHIDQIVANAKSINPNADRATLVNNLTAAYCPVVKKDAALTDSRKLQQLASFSQLVYGRLAQPNERW